MGGESKFTTGNLSNLIIDKEVITSISDEMNLQVSIYPNPTSNIIHIRNNSVTIAHTYEIIDVSGKHYLSERNSKKIVDLDLTEVPSGLYLLLITNKNTSQSYKIIKK